VPCGCFEKKGNAIRCIAPETDNRGKGDFILRPQSRHQLQHNTTKLGSRCNVEFTYVIVQTMWDFTFHNPTDLYDLLRG
jgi:hypothetical protein